MAIKFNAVVCPQCGANLQMEVDREQMFCSYCGTKIIATNENEFVYRHIDEAEIRQADTARYVQMKRMELAEKRHIAEEKTKKTKIIISLVLAVVGILMMTLGYIAADATGDSDSGLYMVSMVGFFPLMGSAYIWLFSKEKDDVSDEFDDRVKVPSSISEFESKNFSAIEAILSSAGFTNIRCVPLNDLTMGWLKKPGMVESITINGHEITSGGKKFSPDAAVVISYHSMANH